MARLGRCGESVKFEGGVLMVRAEKCRYCKGLMSDDKRIA